MTSTWVDADDPGDCHAWRSRVQKKHIDSIMGPRDLLSATWFLNKTGMGTWDHVPVVFKIDGRELRVKKGKKGWAGWIPKSEEKNRSSKNETSCEETLGRWTSQ